MSNFKTTDTAKMIEIWKCCDTKPRITGYEGLGGILRRIAVEYQYQVRDVTAVLILMDAYNELHCNS